MTTAATKLPKFLDLLPEFTENTWRAWRAFLRAAFGLPLNGRSLATYRQHTGRERAPERPCREAWLICGRRAGKSRVAALLAVFFATVPAHRLAPGERGVVMLICSDRRQARVLKRYVAALLASHPSLSALVARSTADTIDLSNRITIEIHTASYRAVRGYTIVAAICDELAFWSTDEGAANPDTEVLAALRPAMATQPESMLVCLSSPYARRGELWRAYDRFFGQDGDVLVWQADTRAMNPDVPQAVIDAAYAADEVAAAAEYGAEFRRDIERFVTREVLAMCLIPRGDLRPEAGTHYVAFVDPSGGASDSMTLAIAHRDGDRGVVDCLREHRAPFNPTQVVGEFAAQLRYFGLATVTGDRYAGEWPRDAFRQVGVSYRLADAPKSELYRSMLPLLTSGLAELPHDTRLEAQLLGLERRTTRGGRDVIDHAPRQHDDLANAVAGALTLATKRAVTPVAFARSEWLL